MVVEEEKTPICQNPKCAYYRKEEGKHIIKRGKNKAGNQRYFCCQCKKYFVETINTFRYHKHLSFNEIAKICKILAEYATIREIEEKTGHHRDTIGRLLEDIAMHTEEADVYFADELGLNDQKRARIWSTILKNKRTSNIDIGALLKKRDEYLHKLPPDFL